MCMPDNFLMHTKMKKNDVPLPRCLHHEQNGSFQNSLSVAAITKNFFQCSIFLETIPCLLFQSSLIICQNVLYALVFHAILLN